MSVAGYPLCVDPQPAAATSATGTRYGVDVGSGSVVVGDRGVIETGDVLTGTGSAMAAADGEDAVVSSMGGADDTSSSVADFSLAQATSSSVRRTVTEVRMISELDGMGPP
jgi:hypothetical protein